MLIYHPAFDAYHAAYRMLLVTKHHPRLEFAKLRILDFFLCFPAEVANVQLPQEHVEIKKFAKALKNIYRGPVSRHRTFRDLEPIQHASARLLALSGVFSPTELENGKIVRTGADVPVRVEQHLADPLTAAAAVEQYVISMMAVLPLQGFGGLKQRTSLMEYRYDTTT